MIKILMVPFAMYLKRALLISTTKSSGSVWVDKLFTNWKKSDELPNCLRVVSSCISLQSSPSKWKSGSALTAD